MVAFELPPGAIVVEFDTKAIAMVCTQQAYEDIEAHLMAHMLDLVKLLIILMNLVVRPSQFDTIPLELVRKTVMRLETLMVRSTSLSYV